MVGIYGKFLSFSSPHYPLIGPYIFVPMRTLLKHKTHFHDLNLEVVTWPTKELVLVRKVVTCSTKEWVSPMIISTSV